MLRFKGVLSALVLGLLVIQPSHSWVQAETREIQEGAIIENILGARRINVRDASGKLRSMRSGDELRPGDEVKVRKGLLVRIAYESGTQVLVTSKTSVRVTGGPEIEVKKGQIRALVNKQVQPKEGNGEYKFFVRSQSATMGVRGTDFIVDVKPQNTEVFTVSGVVDMGNSRQALIRGEATPVRPGFSSSAQQRGILARTKINPPVKFKVNQVVGKFVKAHPRAPRLMKIARTDYKKPERLRKKFTQIRAKNYAKQQEKANRADDKRKPAARDQKGPRTMERAKPGMKKEPKRFKKRTSGYTRPTEKLELRRGIAAKAPVRVPPMARPRVVKPAFRPPVQRVTTPVQQKRWIETKTSSSTPTTSR